MINRPSVCSLCVSGSDIPTEGRLSLPVLCAGSTLSSQHSGGGSKWISVSSRSSWVQSSQGYIGRPYPK